MQGQNTDAENQNEYAVISIKTSPIPNYSNQKNTYKNLIAQLTV